MKSRISSRCAGWLLCLLMALTAVDGARGGVIGVALAAVPAPTDAPVTEAELAADMHILASDAFEGRGPGTAGEVRTTAYIVSQWAAAGLQPLTGSHTPWLQAVPLVERRGLTGEAVFRLNGRAIALDDQEILLQGRGAATQISGAPVVFIGHGVGRDGRLNMDVAGKVVILLHSGSRFGGRGVSPRKQRELLAAGGALAALTVADDGVPWATMANWVQSPDITLDGGDKDIALLGYVSIRGFDRLMEKAGHMGQAVRASAQSADYRGLQLPATADLSATSQVRKFTSHNILARLPGINPDGKVVILLAHWDHLGVCRPDDELDQICNGAVDNASGIAALNAIAKRLASGPPLDRDVIFLATTAEEQGLLGAHYFAAHAPLASDQVAVAFNLDTIAIAPRGTPIAIIGPKLSAYHDAIHAVARSMERRIDLDQEADEFIERQDGAALIAANMPAFMVGGSFSNMALLDAFFDGPYHQPDDEMSDELDLGGAAEDSDLHIALARLFADRSRWDGAQYIRHQHAAAKP